MKILFRGPGIAILFTMITCAALSQDVQDSMNLPGIPIDQETFTMDGELELKTGENLDSLLNLWYVNQSLESAVDEYIPEADTLIPDFSDSVYFQRLAEIPICGGSDL